MKLLSIEYFPLLNGHYTLRMWYDSTSNTTADGRGRRSLLKICRLTPTQNFGIRTSLVGISESTGVWGREQ